MFAWFPIRLGGLIVGDLARVTQSPSQDQFMPQPATQRQHAQIEARQHAQRQAVEAREQARQVKHVCLGCEHPLDLNDPARDFRMHCGITLFDTCPTCGTRKSTFGHFCHHCGHAANLPHGTAAEARP